MAMTMADFKAYMDEHSNRRFDRLDSRLEGIDASVQGNTKRLDEHSALIRSNQSVIRDMKGEIDKIKAGDFPPLLNPATPSRGNGILDSVADRDYAKARRSLRFWPIKGVNKDQLWDAAGIFLGSNLGMTGKLDQKSIESITRVTIPSGPGVRDEALVVFVDNQAQDLWGRHKACTVYR